VVAETIVSVALFDFAFKGDEFDDIAEKVMDRCVDLLPKFDGNGGADLGMGVAPRTRSSTIFPEESMAPISFCPS